MNIIIHQPRDLDSAKELARRIATIHAATVLHSIQKQPISREDQLTLLVAILERK